MLSGELIMEDPIQGEIFAALPMELILHICRWTLILRPSRCRHLRLCCKDWKMVVDKVRTAIAFSVEDLRRVTPYLRKLPSLAALTLASESTDDKVGKALSSIHSLTPGLTSLTLRHNRPFLEGHTFGDETVKIKTDLSRRVLPWRDTLQHLELKQVQGLRRLKSTRGGGSGGGFSFLSQLTGLKSLILTDVNPVLRSTDLTGCSSLQKLRYVRKEMPDGGGMKLNLSSCTALREVDIYGCSIGKLDVSRCTRLEMLQCSQNQLRTLQLLDHPHLRELRCESNTLRNLQLGGCSVLEFLYCADNTDLTTLVLPDSPTLQRLSCSDTDLRSLDVSHCTALQTLLCGGPRMKQLNFSGCTALQLLECSHLRFPVLDSRSYTSLLVVNLYYTTCLKELNVAGLAHLQQLMCYHTPIAKLDVTGCSAMSWLNLESKTKLTLLDMSKCEAVAEPHVLIQGDADSLGEVGSLDSLHVMSCKCCQIENVEYSSNDQDLDAGCEASDRNSSTLHRLGLQGF